MDWTDERMEEAFHRPPSSPDNISWTKLHSYSVQFRPKLVRETSISWIGQDMIKLFESGLGIAEELVETDRLDKRVMVPEWSHRICQTFHELTLDYPHRRKLFLKILRAWRLLHVFFFESPPIVALALRDWIVFTYRDDMYIDNLKKSIQSKWMSDMTKESETQDALLRLIAHGNLENAIRFIHDEDLVVRLGCSSQDWEKLLNILQQCPLYRTKAKTDREFLMEVCDWNMNIEPTEFEEGSFFRLLAEILKGKRLTSTRFSHYEKFYC